MTLAGIPFLVLVVALLVVAVVWAAAWLPRTRRSPRGFLARIATLLGVSLIALLVALVAVNDSFVFYANWGDLFGTAGQTLDPAHAGAPATRALEAPVGGPGLATPTASTLPPLPKPGERVQTFTLKGERSGLTGNVLVILPADYGSVGHETERYPVIEAFHGWPGNPEVFAQAFPIATQMDATVAAHHVHDAIIVAPELEFPHGIDTECVDGGKGQPQVDTWVSHDIPAFVARTLRVRADRASWATLGYSSGAWCAAMTTMLHPDIFGSGIILGGYFNAEFGFRYVPFARSSGAARHYDLVALAGHQPPPVALWVQSSRADGLSWPSSSRLFAAAKPPLSIQSEVLADAGHRASVWLGLIPQALTWLGSTSSGFAPT